MKDFIPFKEAVALKELGLNEPCFATYVGETFDSSVQFLSDDYFTAAPLFSQAFRFFREKYNMLANVYSNASGFLFEWHDTTGGTHRYDAGFDGPNDSGCWDTYEDAEIACLKKLIELVKK